MLDIQELFVRLKKVFSQYGYEGASLSILSETVGLKRASLYHRFPEGKQEMAQFVLDVIGRSVEENIVQVCVGNMPVKQKWNTVLDKVSEMYENGNADCIWRVFSLGEGLKLFQNTIQQQIASLIAGIQQLYLESGENEASASQKALEFFISLQGRLVMVSAMKNPSYFRDFISMHRKNMVS